MWNNKFVPRKKSWTSAKNLRPQKTKNQINLDIPYNDPEGTDYRVVLPKGKPQQFDQLAPENLDDEIVNPEENFIKNKIQNPDSYAEITRAANKQPRISQSQSTPNKWIAFDVGEDDIKLPPSNADKIGIEIITPRVGKNARRFWISKKTTNSVTYGLLCPKIINSCEDSPPIFVTPTSRNQGPTTIGVLDGMGGAGAGHLELQIRSEIISTTEALFASRITRLAVMKALTTETSLTSEVLKNLINDRLQKAESYLKLGEKTRIRGTMTKRLPTTLVLSKVHENTKTNSTQIVTWWAGDSRAFLITPGDGLTMLTRDHVRVGDPLEQLRSDPPIANVVNRSTEFYIDEISTAVTTPFVLLLASDGVFGYLPTPGFLELGLLESLLNSNNKFAENFADFCTFYAADDVSAAVLVRGFSGNSDIKAKFSRRLELLQDRYSSVRTMSSDDASRNSEIERLWAVERPEYLRLSGVGRV